MDTLYAGTTPIANMLALLFFGSSGNEPSDVLTILTTSLDSPTQPLFSSQFRPTNCSQENWTVLDWISRIKSRDSHKLWCHQLPHNKVLLHLLLPGILQMQDIWGRPSLQEKVVCSNLYDDQSAMLVIRAWMKRLQSTCYNTWTRGKIAAATILHFLSSPVTLLLGVTWWGNNPLPWALGTLQLFRMAFWWWYKFKDLRARSTNFPSFSPNSECWLFGGKPRWLESDSTDLPGQFGSEQRAWGGKALGRWRLPLCWLNHCHCFWSKWTISSRDWISLVVRLDHFRHSIKKDTKESQQIKEAHLNHFIDHIMPKSLTRNLKASHKWAVDGAQIFKSGISARCELLVEPLGVRGVPDVIWWLISP